MRDLLLEYKADVVEEDVVDEDMEVSVFSVLAKFRPDISFNMSIFHALRLGG